MSSYRTQIADAFKARLLGATPAGQSVHASLDRPLQPADLPAVLIYTLTAKRGRQDYGNTIIERLVTVNIEAAIQATPATALAQAETMSAAIEAAIEADPTLGNLVEDTRWEQTMSDVSAFGELTLGVVMMEYTVCMLTVRLDHLPPDDGFLTTPTLVQTRPDPKTVQFPEPIAPDPESVCGPDGCDIPAWGGELPR
jgi:hypothetical protein